VIKFECGGHPLQDRLIRRKTLLPTVVNSWSAWWHIYYLSLCNTVFHISSITGTLSSPLSNFEIRVGILTDYKQNPMCGDRVRQLGAGEVWTAECKPPIPGRHVSVSMVGKGYLAICEVAVFARLGEWRHSWRLNQIKGKFSIVIDNVFRNH